MMESFSKYNPNCLVLSINRNQYRFFHSKQVITWRSKHVPCSYRVAGLWHFFILNFMTILHILLMKRDPPGTDVFLETK